MSTSPLTKIALVGLAAGALLSAGDAGLARALAIVAGAALVGSAWVRLGRQSEPPAAPAASEPRARRPRVEDRAAGAAPRIDRTPTARAARDVRCPRRVTARARRSR